MLLLLTRLSSPSQRSSIVRVTEGCEVKAGLGQEALEEAGPVLHPPQPGLDQRGQLIDVVLGEVG